MTSFSGRRVLVVGLGVSGYAAAEALLDQGATVRVTEAGTSAAMEERATVLRSRGATVELGGHDLGRPGHPGNSDCDLAVVSPGIPPSSAIITALRSTEVELIGEIELAYRLAECDFLAVTGTNGKTTTTALLAAILAEGGIDSMAAGNIGTPVVEAVKKIGKGGAIALEVSSFQLSTITTFRPKVAVVLNVAEDHTDWHGSFEAYAADKARITENQTTGDVFMPNIEDPIAAKMVKGTRATTVPFSATRIPEGGIGVTSGKVMWRGREIFTTDDSTLSGVAGLEDSIAAAGAALEYGVDPHAVLRAIKSFQPLGHRLEVVAEIDGVTFINDSKATNPHATLAAVKGLEDVVLIAGGRAKGIDLAPLKQTVPPVSAVVAIGEAADEVTAAFSPIVPVERAGSIADAVRIAYSHAVRGGTVLLSPGCASLDMFASYVERGNAFTEAVKDLIAATQEDD